MVSFVRALAGAFQAKGAGPFCRSIFSLTVEAEDALSLCSIA
jgi:hypothetical protein